MKCICNRNMKCSKRRRCPESAVVGDDKLTDANVLQESGLKYLALHLRANKSSNSPTDARLHAANLQVPFSPSSLALALSRSRSLHARSSPLSLSRPRTPPPTPHPTPPSITRQLTRRGNDDVGQAYKEACGLLSRDAEGAVLPTPLKPADPIVDQFFQHREAGPQGCASN
jgi:hypothetical protein